jgi:hypothetical protein
MFGIGNNNNGQAGNSNGQPELTGGRPAAKTTPDEGKAFDKDAEFVCARDCYLG